MAAATALPAGFAAGGDALDVHLDLDVRSDALVLHVHSPLTL
jgi:uncharacterized protein (DUF2344 family)